MKNLATPFFALMAFALAAGFSTQAVSAEESVEPAKLVVYRAVESSKTRKIKFNASIDGRKLGRLSYKTPLVTEVAAGEVTLGTSISGGADLQITLQPGHTYYVHTQLKRVGQTVTPQLVVVEEQFALTQLPAVDGNI